MAKLWARYQNYTTEIQRLREKTNGRPIPEEKRERCLFRLKELETRILPALEAKLQNPDAHTGLWDYD